MTYFVKFKQKSRPNWTDVTEMYVQNMDVLLKKEIK